MMNLFAYGTLMCEDIMHEVAGCRLSRAPGTLNGFARRAVKGENYPAILADGEGRVDGVVYLNVTAPAWGRLDRFEGEMYERLRVQVMLTDGQTLAAETYVVREEFLGCLEPYEWDFDDFLCRKSSFQSGYKGYQSL